MATQFTFYESVPEFLNAEDMNNFYVNALYVRFLLLIEGYEVGSCRLMEAKTDTPLKNVAEILNVFENNLDIINSALKSQYYTYSKRYTGTAPTKDDVWRWIQILNDLYFKLSNEDVYVLRCSDGYPTINGKKISVKM